jgi:hypothetical protein
LGAPLLREPATTPVTMARATPARVARQGVALDVALQIDAVIVTSMPGTVAPFFDWPRERAKAALQHTSA